MSCGGLATPGVRAAGMRCFEQDTAGAANQPVGGAQHQGRDERRSDRVCAQKPGRENDDGDA